MCYCNPLAERFAWTGAKQPFVTVRFGSGPSPNRGRRGSIWPISRVFDPATGGVATIAIDGDPLESLQLRRTFSCNHTLMSD